MTIEYEFNVKYQDGVKGARSFASSLDNVSDSAKKADESLGDYSDEVRNSGKSTDTLSTKVSKLAEIIKTVLAYQALSAAVTKLVEVQREFDVLNGRLETAVGSASGAAEAFKILNTFASETPYALSQSVDAFITLVNLGLTPSERAMRSYGDTAAAMGKDLTQMIEAVADATVGEFERLKEFGIKASQEGDNVSLTFRGVTTTIKKSAGEIERYLIELGEVNFGGAMENQMKTLDGAISNLGDSWDSLFRTISESGIGDLIEDMVRQSTAALDGMASFIRTMSGAPQTVEEYDKVIDGLRSNLKSLAIEFMEVNEGGFLASTFGRSFEEVSDEIDQVVGRIRTLTEERNKLAEQKPLELTITKGANEDRKRVETSGEAGDWLSNLEMKNATELELIDMQYEARLEKLAQFQDAELISKQDAANAELQIEANKAKQLEELEKKSAATRKQAQGQFFSDLISLTNGNSRKMFEIGKIAAIANATIKGGEAATSAFAAGMSVGGPYAPAVAAAYTAASIAATASQISSIASTSYGGGSGGATTPPTAPTIPELSQTQQSVNINISGLDNDYGKMVIDQINEQLSQGASLNI